MYHRIEGKLVAFGNLDFLHNYANSGYFVYDPDVVPVSGPTPSPAAGTAATTSTATTGSSGAATVSCAAALYLAIVTVLGSIVGQLA